MKKFLLIIFVMNMFGWTFSQSPLVSSKNANAIIEKSLSDVFFITKKSYWIADSTGVQFGRKNREFNTCYSLGVKITDGFVLSSGAVCPWVVDTAFDAYRKKYSPIPGKTEFKTVKDKGFVGLQDSILQTNDSLVFLCQSDAFNGFGLTPDTDKSDKKGFVVWICLPDTNNRFDSLLYVVVNKNIPAKQLDSSSLKITDPRKSVFSLVKNNVQGDVLGGVYVVPYYGAAGHIELRLCGVIVNYGKGWVIKSPFIQEKKETVVSKDELTPVATPNNTKSIKTKKKK